MKYNYSFHFTKDRQWTLSWACWAQPVYWSFLKLFSHLGTWTYVLCTVAGLMYGKILLAKSGRCVRKCRYSFKHFGPGTRWAQWSSSQPGRFVPRAIAHCTHWIGGWVGQAGGLDSLEKRMSPVSTGNQTTISRSFGPLPVQIYFNLTVMADGEHCFRQDV